MLIQSACPKCSQPIDVEHEHLGQIIQCPHCVQEIIVDQPAKRITAPVGLTCPFCRSQKISPPLQKITATGRALIIIGVVGVVVVAGLILILIGMRLKETKYQCFNCHKIF